MSEKIQCVYHCSPQKLVEILQNEEFLKTRSEAMGESQVQVSKQKHGNQIKITNSRYVKRELPSFAKKIFKAENHVVQTEQWHDSTGNYDLTLKGVPVQMSAEFAIAAHPKGCIYSISYNIRAKIPLIRKKIEKYTLEQTIAGVRKEFEFTANHLGIEAEI